MNKVSASDRSGAREPSDSEISRFLRSLYELHMSIGQQLSPLLEDRLGIDMRLHFILRIIAGGVVNPGAIAVAIKLPNSLVTKHLDQLSQKNLLHRTIDRDDSRRICVTLTDRGIDVLREADAILTETVGSRLGRLPGERRAQFVATLVELAQAWEGD
jgi:DNA-binding MarR family transcriptional regulator